MSTRSIERSGPVRGQDFAAELDALRAPMTRLLSDLIAFRSVSGSEGPMTRFLAEHARSLGFEVDLWQGAEADVAALGQHFGRHIPLAGRPTLVVKLPGQSSARSLVFNAHSDVVPAEAAGWKHDAWSGAIEDGRMYGRGACDTKGPLVSALWAMAAVRASGISPAGDILLEVIPGEEDCVGLGTLTSVARGHRADASIVLEPTANLPRCASRGGCRFTLTVLGRAVHGTVKWLGRDALALMRKVLDACDAVEAAWNDRAADPLFSSYPIARPVTVDAVSGGVYQGMVCDRCTAAGYLELLPGDDIDSAKARFRADLLAQSLRRGVPASLVAIEFTEEYTGHATSFPGNDLCGLARTVVDESCCLPGVPRWDGWSGFNSGCEAGARWSLDRTPTLVWGPGDLRHAHAVNESIGLDEVHAAAVMFAKLARAWTAGPAPLESAHLPHGVST